MQRSGATSHTEQTDTVKKVQKTPGTGADPALVRQYHVILLDDDDHSFAYVIEMLQVIFRHPRSRGYLMAWEVHRTGRVIVLTTHKELAELRQKQIHDYGADPRIPRCKGSMTAVLQPA